MADDSKGLVWPPALFADQLQQAGEEAVERQAALFNRWLQASTGTSGRMDGVSGLAAMSMGTAAFKTRVQSGGRISIPDAEREALDIDEGDLVQAIVIPIENGAGDSNE